MAVHVFAERMSGVMERKAGWMQAPCRWQPRFQNWDVHSVGAAAPARSHGLPYLRTTYALNEEVQRAHPGRKI